jgi:hypothetical protein
MSGSLKPSIPHLQYSRYSTKNAKMLASYSGTSCFFTPGSRSRIPDPTHRYFWELSINFFELKLLDQLIRILFCTCSKNLIVFISMKLMAPKKGKTTIFPLFFLLFLDPVVVEFGSCVFRDPRFGFKYPKSRIRNTRSDSRAASEFCPVGHHQLRGEDLRQWWDHKIIKRKDVSKGSHW